MMHMGFASAHAGYGTYPPMGMGQMQPQAGFGFYGSQGMTMDGSNYRNGEFPGMMQCACTPCHTTPRPLALQVITHIATPGSKCVSRVRSGSAQSIHK